MKRCLSGAALLAALYGIGACGTDDEPFGSAGAAGRGGSGGSSGRGGAEAGEGGSSTDDSLEDIEVVRRWANVASALGVYVSVYQPIAVADGEETFPDPSCPEVTDDGTTLEITGDCSEATGKEWIGSATVVRSGAGDRDLTLDGFGTAGDNRTGEAQIRRVDDTHHDFVVNLAHETDVVMTYDYSGQVEGGYDTRTVWSGSGTVTRQGTELPIGRIEATTTDEVVDNDVCEGQPASGNTTLRDRNGNTAVITYDGSVDCDDAQAASYSLNGEPEGEITGIACAVSPAFRAKNPTALLFALLVLGLFRARRARL